MLCLYPLWISALEAVGGDDLQTALLQSSLTEV